MPQPSAPPIPKNWRFAEPLREHMVDIGHTPFQVHIKPREPPMFTGEKGQDVMT